jgi:RNA polymerase sigma-70 factor, ECF subfamily
MPKVGLEPTWGNPQRCLRPSRLPFRHFGVAREKYNPTQSTRQIRSSLGSGDLMVSLGSYLARIARKAGFSLPPQLSPVQVTGRVPRGLLSTSYDEGYAGRATRPSPRRPEYDEAALIAAAQRGELPAFNQLILHYQGLAYNVAYRVVGDDEMASDATQDAFIKAYQRLAQYRGGSFKAWLLRIVTNTCYDALRARKRRPTTPLENEEDEDDPEYNSRLIDMTERPEAYAMRQELASVIQAAIGLLPPDQRATLILADVEGLDYQEIADATGAALGTVKSRLSRARAKLRDLLLEHQELLPAQYRHSDS